ncbi:hypothetical protein GLAREA_00969 [Glarea lozoyensis ATCC 20868]|uniref:2EXR domain-containing protein n=1 Tax=Glarea lozoyensis (strain ATCC 20868 / MF5171) TaxID=1116229 RepID=S3CY04_GLAL2|nr:uncharacterized protein GLAREA_00969 [Glarea lozoyensis ATCC 20868]EPE29809.1 hypothetical protein GLAREA_00969 [Glarea lozoyensis ATCC 20868]
MATPTEGIQKYFNFTKLPIELQLAIIHLTYEPQIIVLETNYKAITVPRNVTPAPVSLHVNRLWREEALKFYELLSYEDIPELFPDETTKKLALETLPRVYMNLATDNIKLSPHPLDLDDAIRFNQGNPEKTNLGGFEECKGTIASGYGGYSKALQNHMFNLEHMELAALLHNIREMVFIGRQGYESEDHVKELIRYYEQHKARYKHYFTITEIGYIKQGVGFVVTASSERPLVGHRLGRIDNVVIERLKAYGWFQG